MPTKENRYISRKVKCEYYKDHNSQRIRCIGTIDGMIFTMTNQDGEKVKRHRRRYCYTKNWRECPFARLHEKEKK